MNFLPKNILPIVIAALVVALYSYTFRDKDLGQESRSNNKYKMSDPKKWVKHHEEMARRKADRERRMEDMLRAHETARETADGRIMSDLIESSNPNGNVNSPKANGDVSSGSDSGGSVDKEGSFDCAAIQRMKARKEAREKGKSFQHSL